jgi:hypothetical protein
MYLLADIILIIHFLFVGFILSGFILIWTGALFKWRWIRNRTFRIVHLCAITFVALESVFGMTCPLTDWEHQLRISSGGGYDSSFMQYWVHKILFYSAPEWVFTVIYVFFTATILLTWFFVRPLP